MEKIFDKYKKAKIRPEYEDDKKDFKDKNINEIIIDIKKISTQTSITLEGIQIYFPYNPYEEQIIYMSKAALESPTGTGKTLCLLCASLAWLKNKRSELKKDNNQTEIKQPVIFYTSRTHSQLSNVIKELKKTCYLPRTAVLSSRENLCVNAIVKNSSGSNINLKCKIARSRKECKYYQNSHIEKISAYDNLDIEEMKRIGENSSFCPFYFQRKKKDAADIIFLPYNYIFTKKLISILNLDLTNSVLLIDEAHNIDKVCEDSFSFELSTRIIDGCLDDLKQVSLLKEKNSDSLSDKLDKKDSKDDFLNMIDIKMLANNVKILTSIKSYLKNLNVLNGNWPNIGKRLSVKDLFDFLFEGSKTEDNTQAQISDFIKIGNKQPDKIGFDPINIVIQIKFLEFIEKGLSEEFNKNSNLFEYVEFLSQVSDIYFNYNKLKINESQNPGYKIENDIGCLANNYKFFVLEDEENNTYGNYKNQNDNQKNKKNSESLGKNRKICLFCMNPGIGFESLKEYGIHTTILTSGTLSPFSAMEAELKVDFQVKLENSHVVDQKQVNFCIIKNSLDQNSLPFDFRMKSRNVEMNEKLGQTISDLIKVTPKGTGVLCFFTSYGFMNSCLSSWTNNRLLSDIEKYKEIFKDQQNSTAKNIVKSFNESCAENKNSKKKGGVLFSVLRGSSSEGIDFSDDKARMVIVVGIPYPNLGDIKVNLKKEYLEEYLKNPKRNQNIKVRGNEWYENCAIKAVNQALGRVIRHVNDYGTMVLIDCRYNGGNLENKFSKWIRDNLKYYGDKSILEETKMFYSNIENFIALRKEEQKNNINLKHDLKNKKTNQRKSDDEISNIESLPFGKKDAGKNNIQEKISTKNLKLEAICSTNKNFITPSEKNNDNSITSFMKSKEELEESLAKNSMNQLIIKNEEINDNNIKKNLDSLEFSRDILNINNINKININKNKNKNEDGDFKNINNMSFEKKKIINSNNNINNNNRIKEITNSSSNKSKQSNNNYSSIKNFFKSIPKISESNNDNDNGKISKKLDMNINNIDIDQKDLDLICLMIEEEEKKFVKKEDFKGEITTNFINSKKITNEITDEYLLSTDDLNIIMEDNYNNNDNFISKLNKNKRSKNNFKIEKLRRELKNEYIPVSNNDKISDNNNINNIIENKNSSIKDIDDESSKQEEFINQFKQYKDQGELNKLFEKYNVDVSINSNKKSKNEVNKKECPICFEDDADLKFSTARCGHIICDTCWEKQLEIKLECPICKRKTRKVNLRKIIL